MAEEDDSKKQHAIFGSAGMAASGMMKGQRPKRTAKEDSPEVTAENEEAAEEIVAEEETPETVEETTAEFEAPLTEDLTGLRGVVAGHSGAGNFGHGLETVFQRLNGVRFVALSDANDSTLEEARTHAGAPAGYPDLETMIEAEKPELVCVAPEWTDQRYSMIKSALEGDAHVVSEAPVAQTLKEADELLNLAKSKSLHVAVMSPMRVDPHVLKFREELTEVIGDLRQLHVWGACNETSGGEDLILVGTQLFDLVRFFAGEVSYCTASVTTDGMAAIADDAHESSTRNLGRLLGDVIHAEFEMDSGIQVSFLSDRRLQSALGPAGIEFVGTKSRMRLFAGTPVTLSLLKNPSPDLATRTEEWEQWPDAQGPYHAPVDHLSGSDASTRLVVNDWLNAIGEESSPTASLENAVKALEMAHGVWQAAVTMKRAFFPLANRLHPLSEDSQ